MSFKVNFLLIRLNVICILIAISGELLSQNVDPNFKPVIKGVPYVSVIHTLPDGKIIIGGDVSSVGLTPTHSILKLNVDGTLDNTFQSSIYLVNPGRISTLDVDPDGKIIVGAIQQKLDGQNYLVRLSPEGIMDNTFSFGNKLQNILKVMALNNGKYLVSSEYTYNFPNRLYRINNDGSLDETFNAYQDQNGNYSGSFEIQKDGKILCAYTNPSTNGFTIAKLLRLNSDGTLDETFEIGTCEAPVESQSLITDIKVQGNEKIIIAGEFKYYKGAVASKLIRLNSDGKIDTTFNNPSFLDTLFNFGKITSINISNNRIAITGMHYESNGEKEEVISLNEDGSKNENFSPIGFFVKRGSWFNPIVNYDNDKLYIIGDHVSQNSSMCMGIAAIDTTGSLIKEFSPLLGGNPIVSAVYQQKDGKIIIGGVFSQVDSLYTNNIIRFNKNGSVDTAFLKNIGNGVDLQLRTIASQSDSSILIGGDFTSVNDVSTGLLARLKPDGRLDTDFKASVIHIFSGEGINKIIVDSLDQIIIGGEIDYVNGESRKALAFLYPDGTLNSSILSSPIRAEEYFKIKDLAYQSDKRLILIGEAINSSNKSFIIRLDKNGIVDQTFPNNISDYYVFSLDILDDNSIVVGNIGWNDDSRIILLDPDGNLIDNTSIAFKQKDEGDPVILSIQHSGKDQLIAGGRFSSVNEVEKPALIKVSLKGDVDEYFKYDVDGRIMRFLQEDSTHLFVAGNFNRIGNDNDLFCIARIDINFPSEPTDLSGENSGKKDSPSIMLNWKDKSTNESGFSIERSIDNKVFEKISTVGANTYTYNDQSIESNQKYYYRVKAYNSNGGSSYSNIIEVTSPGTGIDEVVNTKDICVSPNPGNGEFIISFKDFDNAKIYLEIYNSIGSCIFNKDVTLLCKYYQLPVNIAQQPKGIYFIKITSGDKNESIKYIRN